MNVYECSNPVSDYNNLYIYARVLWSSGQKTQHFCAAFHTITQTAFEMCENVGLGARNIIQKQHQLLVSDVSYFFLPKQVFHDALGWSSLVDCTNRHISTQCAPHKYLCVCVCVCFVRVRDQHFRYSYFSPMGADTNQGQNIMRPQSVLHIPRVWERVRGIRIYVVHIVHPQCFA